MSTETSPDCRVGECGHRLTERADRVVALTEAIFRMDRGYGFEGWFKRHSPREIRLLAANQIAEDLSRFPLDHCASCGGHHFDTIARRVGHCTTCRCYDPPELLNPELASEKLRRKRIEGLLRESQEEVQRLKAELGTKRRRKWGAA